MPLMTIESMDHLADAFDSHKPSPPPGFHYSQERKTSIKMKLLFIVAISPDDLAHSKEMNAKMISVKVPFLTPVYRLRALIAYLEKELEEIYLSAKRLNFVLTSPEKSNEWTINTGPIPAHGVVYV